MQYSGVHTLMKMGTPTIILRLLESNPAIPDLCYVDADLYFYSDPEVLFTEMGDGAVLVHEHRYSSDLASLESTCGRFNVGLLQFKQHPDALTVLRWWRAEVAPATSHRAIRWTVPPTPC